MKKTLYTLIILLAATFTLSAQKTTKLPGQVAVFKPAALDRDIIKESDIKGIDRSPYGQDGRKTGASYWIAFNDREGNPTYTGPDGAVEFGRLPWGKKVWIADIQNGFAQLFYEPKNDCPRISAGAEFLGWVPVKKLLLWDKCLSDEIGISRKAVVCVDLDRTGKEKKDINRKRFDSPSGSNGIALSTDMHFYYILKQENGRYLLGYNADIKDANDLFGWVDANSYVPWNSRTCLEPTWEVEDVKYFASKFSEWRVYTTRDMKGKPMIHDVFKTDPREKTERTSAFVEEYKYRTYPTYYLRFPILDGGDNNVYHCTSFGTLNPAGSKPSSFSEQANKYDQARRDAQKKLAQLSIVNIVIVIDGTSSMKPYFDAVKKALGEVEKFFPDDKVNVGVVIYRDKEDGKYVTECFPDNGSFVQPRNQNLRKWLDTGGEYGVKSKAKSEQEAVYLGIDTALDTFFPTSKDMKKQSNIMLVIGDCGDNGKFKIQEKTLIDKLAAQNVAFMGFQVTNKGTEVYESFNQQLTYLMRSSVQKRYANITKQEINIVAKKLPRGYDIKNEDTEGRNFFIGMFRYNPVANKPMLVEDLTGAIEEILGIWKGSVDQLATIAGNFIETGEKESLVKDNVVGTQLDREAVIALIGEDNYEALKDQNSLTSFRGYAPKEQDTRPYFKVIVFFPASELKNLVRDFEKVYQAAKGDRADRKPYYDAMMSLARTAVAQNEINSTSYYAILAKIFGIANYTPKNGYTLDDIVDPNVVSYNEYRKIVSSMSMSIEQLKGVTNTDYPFLMDTQKTKDKYYWLPSEYLPIW